MKCKSTFLSPSAPIISGLWAFRSLVGGRLYAAENGFASWCNRFNQITPK
jgi:hypothetical protein